MYILLFWIFYSRTSKGLLEAARDEADASGGT
jgi:hypothetical protein